MIDLKRVAVYCGAATPADPRYVALAQSVGAMLAERGIGLVYGGGNRGLMGAVASGALAAGGEVIGVIPKALWEVELAHGGLGELHVVDTMHERKAMFTQLADAFVTLPGGVGTMDELWEAVSWAQLGYHAKPVGLLNAFGYYDHLLAFNAHMVTTGFVRPAHAGIIVAREEIGDLLGALAAYQPHRQIFSMRTEDL